MRGQVAGARGPGALQVFVDVKDSAEQPVRADSAVAELVREDGDVEASAALLYEDGRHRGNLGRPPAGTYRLRAILVVGGWTVRLAGPVVERVQVGPPVTAGSTSGS